MADLKSWNLWHGCRKYSEGCGNCGSCKQVELVSLEDLLELRLPQDNK